MTRANTIADVFWQAAEAPSDDRTAHDVVLHALLALRAFDAGDVRSPKDGNPLRLMGLVAEMGLEEDLVYASPELVRGETFDVRALVFTLGVLIFERLTDRHPFGSSDNPTRLARLRRGEMGSGVNYLPSVPKDLRAILMRAMGPFPEERYGTLAELRSELAEFVGRDDLAVGHDSEQDAKPRSSRHAPTGDQTLPVIPAREKRPGSGQVARLGEHKPPAPETPPEPAPDDSRVAGAAPAHESRSRRPDPPPRPPAPTPAELADVLEPEPEPPDLSPLPPAGGSRATTPAHAAAPAAAARPKMAPLLYALVGAAVASALFLLAGRGSKRQANEGSARGTTEAQPVKGAMKSPHAAAASRAKGTAGETPDTKSPVKILPPPATGAAKAGSAAPTPAAAHGSATGSSVAGSAGSVTAAPGSVTAAPGSGSGSAGARAAGTASATAHGGGGSGSGSGSAAATPPVAAAKAPTPAAADGGDDPAIAAGKRVAKALEPCNLRRRAGPELRIAVYVNAKRSNAIRGFVSRQPWMTATHTRCVKRALVGLELGITLRAAGFIEWGLRLRPDQTIVRLRRPKRLPLLR